MRTTNFNNYIIYSDGRIYSKKRNIFLKQHKTKYGYMKVVLCTNGETTTYNTHRLIARFFVPNPYPDIYNQVNHLDGDKTNNNDWNLAWTDAIGNISHSIESGLKPDIRGEKNKSAILSSLDVSFIKSILLPVFTDSEISEVFKVDRSTIYKIRNNKTWRHIK